MTLIEACARALEEELRVVLESQEEVIDLLPRNQE
jgi:hypothetical protein